MSYTLIEPCAGSAAFTLHLLGARSAVLPYQGSKWRFRHCLQDRAERLGFVGRPGRVVLTDPSPWGRTLTVILDRRQLQALVDRLHEVVRDDPSEVFRRLQGAGTPHEDVAYAAEFLFLQRLAFSGKAVGTRNGRWVSPGFNKTSAYGVAATDRFGEVQPMIPSLIRVLEGYVSQLVAADVEVRNERAALPHGMGESTLVYLDPPYVGSTCYPDGQMPRQQVIELAQAWRHAGAAVMVSEQHGLDLPGWSRSQVYSGRNDTSPFRGKQEEWVTFAPPAVAAAAAKFGG